jgi:uroporphyrinogen-III synthase
MQPSLFIGRNIGTETKLWLTAGNISFEEHPLIRIEFCKPPMFSSVEKGPKHYVVSSQWAAKWLVKYKTKIDFESCSSILCLSEKQMEICKTISENIFVASKQNALSMAQLISEKNHGEQMVYLSGNLSLDTFELEMKSLGIVIQKIEVYRNKPVLKKLSNTFGVYLFFSPSGAENFVKSGNRIPRTSNIAAIGTTTANACERLFNREILISKKQEELAAVQFAAGLLNHSEIRLNTI